MRDIRIFCLLIAFSLNAHAAFTEPEMSQLAEINEKVLEKVEMAKKDLDKTIKRIPEEKRRILDLKKSWEVTIQKKCTLEIFESLHRDAEIAERSSCLVDEYKAESEFFYKLRF
ncbi:hypothetical protein [Pantoea cypripedii]|uniref:Lysozyme inhibitor LprI N-terminal domain-containing protein n=1 Tax=Pantoea cypripedii TaxID=55209 RepID=A0A6B9G8H1_PANCY|nr:hypothetical protein [Pantoea cypripedii]QGY28406.1 hypothetical protein CUN67_05445 [Pantoea cypripedii]